MICNEEAYYTGYYRNVRAMGAISALVFDTIVWQIRVHQSGEIANSTIQEMLGVKSKKTISDAIKDLIADGWIVRTKGNGSGNKSVYMLTEKGIKNAPFIEEKGIKNDPKMDKKITQKGIKNAPLLKDIKELKESDGVLRETQPTPLSNTTTKNFEKMEDFNLFCELYPVDPVWSWRKDECANVWRYMSQEWRNKLIEQLQNGLRWRVRKDADPFWYLKNYEGQDVQVELPFIRQMTKEFARWMEEHEKKDKICFIRYEDNGAFCLEKDLQTMIDAGAVWVRNWNF